VTTKRLAFAVDPNDPNGPFGEPYQQAAELIGKKWTAAIIFSITRGHHRFGQLSSLLPAMSERMLSIRLKELEAANVIVRHVYAETPVLIEYELTAHGESLRDVLIAINRWATDEGRTSPKT
jgi:DNA-binding HxlR family transcriptional regulator